jgi:hypothetical protein
VSPQTPTPRSQPSRRLEVAGGSSGRSMRSVPTSTPTPRISRSSYSPTRGSSGGGRSGGNGDRSGQRSR